VGTLIHDIVKKIGGDVMNGGRTALCPGPGHSKHDRSMSLKLDANNELIVNSFSSRTTWQDCRRDLEDRGLIPAFDAQSQPSRAPRATHSAPAKQEYDPEKLAYARQLWDAGRSIADTLAAQYHARRALSVSMTRPECVRFLAECDPIPYGSKRGRPRYTPAMLSKITDPSGAFCGVQVTLLTSAGAKVRRFTLGRMMGAAIRIQPAQERLLVAEGYETAQSAGRLFGAPPWALLSEKNFYEWSPPASVTEIIIAGDPGEAGESAAAALQERCERRGIATRVVIPDGDDDWNALDTKCG